MLGEQRVYLLHYDSVLTQCSGPSIALKNQVQGPGVHVCHALFSLHVCNVIRMACVIYTSETDF